MSTKKILLLSIILLKFYVASAQLVNASLSKNRILVGDTLSLTLSVDVAVGTQVVFPVLMDTVAAGVEIIGTPLTDSIRLNSRMIYTQRLVISAYDSAMYLIGPLKAVLLKSGQKDTIQSNVLSLFADYQLLNQDLEAKIDTALTEQIVMNKPNFEAAFTLKELWLRVKNFLKNYWYFVLALIILIAFGLYYYYKVRNKGRVVMTAPELKIKPETEAIQMLEALEGKKLWQQGKLKDYYSELSDILRHYAERQFHIIALEATTDLIRRQIKYRNLIADESEKELYDMLILADYVKFAKYQTQPMENERALKRAVAFVEATIPKPVTQPVNEVEK